MRVAPQARENDAPDACLLASRYGLTPDPWQADVLESWLGRDRADRWAAATCGLAVPRQNGKNGVLEVRELYGMALLGERFLHTAHEVKTARKAFLRIASFFENTRHFPELAAMCREVRKTNGQEAIFLDNGGSIEFIARSRGSGRGFTVDVLVCDEAQDLADEELAALLPTISASPSGNPQVIFTGTPPRAGAGLPFRRVREDGELGRDPRLAWTDFGAPDGPLPDVDDRELWRQHNPAEGVRLALAEIERERALMSPETFAVERLGYWGQTGGGSNAIMPAWPSRVSLEQPGPPAALGIAVDLDRVWISVGACDTSPIPHIGPVHVAGPAGAPVVVRQRLDVGRVFVIEQVARIQRETGCVVALDRKGPAGSLEADLEAAGVRLSIAGLDDAVTACADLYDAVVSGQVCHGAYDELDAAVENATQRKVGDRWAWARRNGDVSMLEAVTLALWGAKQFVAEPFNIW